MEKITTDISTFENIRRGGYAFGLGKRDIDEPLFAKLWVFAS